jgi:hypothetical protein
VHAHILYDFSLATKAEKASRSAETHGQDCNGKTFCMYHYRKLLYILDNQITHFNNPFHKTNPLFLASSMNVSKEVHSVTKMFENEVKQIQIQFAEL